jgi:hypothetical protein
MSIPTAAPTLARRFVRSRMSTLGRIARAGFDRAARRQRYERMPGNGVTGSSRGRALTLDEARFDIIPRGRAEPFSTAEYDVLPRDRYDFVRSDYYSPIPNVEAIPEAVWARRSELRGVSFDLERAFVLLEHELAPFIAELDVPLTDPHRPGEFFLHNQTFESVDAELLYAFVRSLRPARVIELGSGYTSLLINLAANRNAAEGTATEHLVYDPYPRPAVIGDRLVAPSKLVPIAATDVTLDTFDTLSPGDILFVDTTHTVKVGSDVNYVVLDVLPRLRPGVVVHFHDIFLPSEYPSSWFKEQGYFWNEQYLLQAFLAFNLDFEVLVPAQAMAKTAAHRLKAVIPSFRDEVSPASIWMRRRDGTGRRTGNNHSPHQ